MHRTPIHSVKTISTPSNSKWQSIIQKEDNSVTKYINNNQHQTTTKTQTTVKQHIQRSIRATTTIHQQWAEE